MSGFEGSGQNWACVRAHCPAALLSPPHQTRAFGNPRACHPIASKPATALLRVAVVTRTFVCAPLAPGAVGDGGRRTLPPGALVCAMSDRYGSRFALSAPRMAPVFMAPYGGSRRTRKATARITAVVVTLCATAVMRDYLLDRHPRFGDDDTPLPRACEHPARIHTYTNTLPSLPYADGMPW